MADRSAYTDEITERVSNAKQAVSEAVHHAKDRMNQVGGVIVDNVEETRDAAADAAHSASESLHAKPGIYRARTPPRSWRIRRLTVSTQRLGIWPSTIPGRYWPMHGRL